jgi:hypothetical protein
MHGRVLVLLIGALSLSGAQSFAQTMQLDAPLTAQAGPADTSARGRQGDDDTQRLADEAYEEHAHAAPPADPPDKEADVTVGVGSSIDRAPRDIREPFDE